MTYRDTLDGSKLIWTDAYTLATVSVSPLADAVAEMGRLWAFAARNAPNSRLEYRQDAYYNLDAQQPAVFA